VAISMMEGTHVMEIACIVIDIFLQLLWFGSEVLWYALQKSGIL
jgi:hypothetical protein